MATPAGIGFRRLSSLLAQAREPVVALDAQVKIVFVNAAWELLTGIASEAVLGRSCWDIDPATDVDEILRGLVPPPEALDGRPSATSRLLIHRDGTRTWKTVEFLPFHDRDNVVGGYVAIFRTADASSIATTAASQAALTALNEVRELLRARRTPVTLIGQGPRHERLLRQVAAASATQIPVLIVGEPGVGKSHLARAIHDSEVIANQSIVVFDIGVLPTDRLHIELFGTVAVSWNRAVLPEGCTLVLKEIAKIPRDLQAKLVTASTDRDVRVIATSSVDPNQALSNGLWSNDFFYSMTSMVIQIDPLRDRLTELPILAQHFLEEACSKASRRELPLLPETLKSLAEYDWPGNLRELRRVIAAIATTCQGNAVVVRDLPAAIRGEYASAYAPPPLSAVSMPLDDWLGRLEKRLIELALNRSHQNKSKAAEFLEVSRPRLYRRIKELNIPDLPETAEPNTS